MLAGFQKLPHRLCCCIRHFRERHSAALSESVDAEHQSDNKRLLYLYCSGCLRRTQSGSRGADEGHFQGTGVKKHAPVCRNDGRECISLNL